MKNSTNRKTYLNESDICVYIEERFGRQKPFVTSKKSYRTSLKSIIKKIINVKQVQLSLEEISDEVDKKRIKPMIQMKSKLEHEDLLQDMLPVLKKEEGSTNYELYIKAAINIFDLFVRNGIEPTPEMLNDIMQIYVDAIKDDEDELDDE